MTTDPHFDGTARFGAEAPVREKKSGMSTCLMGCLIALVLMVILAVIVGVVVYMNWRNWMAAGASTLVKQTLVESQLPAQEIEELNIQVDRLAEGFRTGQLTGEKAAKVFEQLSKSPLLTTIGASVIEHKYLANSGLNAEEKTQGSITLQRFLRGAIDKKIPESAINSAMANVADKQPNGNWKLRDTLTDEELRKFLEVAKAEADKAGIPEAPQTIDPSEELKRIVDEALGELPAEAPPVDAVPKEPAPAAAEQT
jgi:hypothetical protein